MAAPVETSIDRANPVRCALPPLDASLKEPNRIFARLDDPMYFANRKAQPLVPGCGVENRFRSTDALDAAKAALGGTGIDGAVAMKSEIPPLLASFAEPRQVFARLDDLMDIANSKARTLVTGCGVENRVRPTVALDLEAAPSVGTSNDHTSSIRSGLQLDRLIHGMASFKKSDGFDSISNIVLGQTLADVVHGAPVIPVRDAAALSRTDYLA